MPELDLWWWVLVFGAAVALNVVPGFMPPTWTLLAFAHFQWSLPIAGLAVVGGIGSSTGRFFLALLARRFGTRFLPKKHLANVGALAKTLDAKRGLSLSALALFAVGPLPTNHLFIAAGIARIRLLWPLLVFGIARSMSYAIWVSAANKAVISLGDALTPAYGSWVAIAAQIAGFAGLVMVMRIDWARRLERWRS